MSANVAWVSYYVSLSNRTEVSFFVSKNTQKIHKDEKRVLTSVISPISSDNTILDVKMVQYKHSRTAL